MIMPFLFLIHSSMNTTNSIRGIQLLLIIQKYHKGIIIILLVHIQPHPGCILSSTGLDVAAGCVPCLRWCMRSQQQTHGLCEVTRAFCMHRKQLQTAQSDSDAAPVEDRQTERFGNWRCLKWWGMLAGANLIKHLVMPPLVMVSFVCSAHTKLSESWSLSQSGSVYLRLIRNSSSSLSQGHWMPTTLCLDRGS